MHSAGFEPAFPVFKTPHTLRLTRKVGVGKMRKNGRCGNFNNKKNVVVNLGNKRQLVRTTDVLSGYVETVEFPVWGKLFGMQFVFRMFV